ncbi:type II toxin-antitoxin system RelE family toxin [Maridesulfovibrio sp.]|uniref:type II toxin-antitoxin system RelE family toxin n=1 Tax=unclassified Maridesulfovibrio TaxID=2794999 RepID=UPI003AFF8DBF
MYEISFTKSAQKQFCKLPSSVQSQLQPVIEGLKTNPRPHGYTKLSGQLSGFFRVRSGSYRIIYSIDDGKLVVMLLKIGNRKEIYKK